MHAWAHTLLKAFALCWAELSMCGFQSTELPVLCQICRFLFFHSNSCCSTLRDYPEISRVVFSPVFTATQVKHFSFSSKQQGQPKTFWSQRVQPTSGCGCCAVISLLPPSFVSQSHVSQRSHVTERQGGKHCTFLILGEFISSIEAESPVNYSPSHVIIGMDSFLDWLWLNSLIFCS